jgi:hypothetical protein
MPAGSLRISTLGELAQNEQMMKSLLAESETLFVEHKAGIARGEGYQLAKAVGSFGNTLGGWVLVGVRDGKPIPDWKPPDGGFVDAVRQRLEGQLDPLPSFAADVLRVEGSTIGVVRVYESTDTPHILLADGSVVVREPAQDAKLRKRGQYEATPIRSHYELAQLMQRGRVAEETATSRFDPKKSPFLEESLHFYGPAVTLRAAPLNLSSRWREWAVSESGVAAMRHMAEVSAEGRQELEALTPHPTGVAVRIEDQDWMKWETDGHRSFRGMRAAVVDGGGVIGLRLGYKTLLGSGNSYDWRRLADDGQLEAFLRPLVNAVVDTLADAEHLGRYAVHLIWSQMGELFRVEPENAGEGSPPNYVPGGGFVTVDGLGDGSEREDLIRQWSEELLRATGLRVWRRG